jgi:hypothetical protein
MPKVNNANEIFDRSASASRINLWDQRINYLLCIYLLGWICLTGDPVSVQ